MTFDMTIKVGGAAGQGIQTVGSLLTTACQRAGYYIMGINDFESRIRGGHSFFQLRISDAPVYAPSHQVDLLIALNEATLKRHQDQLTEKGIVLIDGGEDTDAENIHTISFAEDAKKAGGKIYANTVAAAAALCVLGAKFDFAASIIKSRYGNRKEKIREQNLKAATLGYEAADKIPFALCPLAEPSDAKGDPIQGSMALASGVLAADCRVVSFYPMSPATGIMTHLAGWTDQVPLVVEQAEDEIAAVNMAIGASFAGVRAMTATSGGGFCLMTEGLGLAAITETPIVIVNAQRPGPATGLPTRTAQGDLDFVIHASQDDFPRFVFAPGSPTQMFELTKKAFNLSEKFQVPAIILVDQYLMDSIFTLETPFEADETIDRFTVNDKDLEQPDTYQRYSLTSSGISMRALPCRGKALVVASSDEHAQHGHITEDIEQRNAMVEKRNAKLPAMTKELDAPEGDFLDAATLLIGWGSTAGALKEAVHSLREKGEDVGYLLFTDIWPFPTDAISKKLSPNKPKIIVVEQNATAQFGRLLKTETGMAFSGSVLKYDGRPFTGHEICEAVKQMEEI